MSAVEETCTSLLGEQAAVGLQRCMESVKQSAHSIECVDEAVDTQLKAAIICLCTSREKQCMQRITKQNILFLGWGEAGNWQSLLKGFFFF